MSVSLVKLRARSCLLPSHLSAAGKSTLIVKPRTLAVTLFAGLTILTGCNGHESEQQRHDDANTPAGKAGQAAHKMAVEADKAAQEAKRKLQKAAHDAHEGWNEDAKKDQGNK